MRRVALNPLQRVIEYRSHEGQIKHHPKMPNNPSHPAPFLPWSKPSLPYPLDAVFEHDPRGQENREAEQAAGWIPTASKCNIENRVQASREKEHDKQVGIARGRPARETEDLEADEAGHTVEGPAERLVPEFPKREKPLAHYLFVQTGNLQSLSKIDNGNTPEISTQRSRV